jgi:hypothetical protein
LAESLAVTPVPLALMNRAGKCYYMVAALD